MKYLAIDYGTKRIGLAMCDPGEIIVSPLAVIGGQKEALKKIVEVIKTENVEGVVLGLPVNMDGSEGHQSLLTRKFADMLSENIDVPIYFQDERLTSFAAEEKLADVDLSRKKKKKRLDAIAAAEILEAFLDNKTSELP